MDRWNRHLMVIITQILAMIQELLLAGLMFSGHITVWQIILLSLLLLVALVSLAGVAYAQLLPVFVQQILHGGPRMQGLLASSTGFGALIGAALLAARLKNLRQLIRPIYVQKGVIPEVADGIQSASGATQP